MCGYVPPPSFYALTPVMLYLLSSLRYPHSDNQVAAPSYVCDVTNSRQQSSQPSRHTLIMFLFLEDPSSTEKTQLSDNIRWKQQMEVVHKLRVMLQGLIMSQSRKFHQATHSALNKIACNYGSHSKVHSCVYMFIVYSIIRTPWFQRQAG